MGVNTTAIAGPSMAGYFFRMVLSLLLIIVITYVVLRIIRRQQAWQQAQKPWIKVLDYQSLGANRGVYLAEIMNEAYILGVSEGQINILKEIDKTSEDWLDIQEYLLKEDAIQTGVKNAFDIFRRFTPFGKKNDNSFQSQLTEQLQRSQRLSRLIKKGGDDDE